VCVCVCERERERERMCVCVCERERERECTRLLLRFVMTLRWYTLESILKPVCVNNLLAYSIYIIIIIIIIVNRTHTHTHTHTTHLESTLKTSVCE